MSGYTSGRVHKDPEPWRNPNDGRRSSHGVKWISGRDLYQPRPVYDNHNPILVELRRTVDLGASLPAMVQVFRNWFRFGKAEKISATLAQANHAWRVLEKLAFLTMTPNGVTD